MLIAALSDANEIAFQWGENAESMRRTINSLRLPASYPSNKGEKVFYLFAEYLDGISDNNPVSFTQKVYYIPKDPYKSALKTGTNSIWFRVTIPVLFSYRYYCVYKNKKRSCNRLKKSVTFRLH